MVWTVLISDQDASLSLTRSSLERRSSCRKVHYTDLTLILADKYTETGPADFYRIAA